MRLSTTTASLCAGFVGLAALLSPAAAHASTPPAWEGAANPSAIGTITFYDGNGHVVTSGSIGGNAPTLSLYAVGSALPHNGDTKALLEFAQPNPSVTNPDNWSVATLSAQASTFPVTASGTPSVISTMPSTSPVVAESSIDTKLQSDIASYPNTGPSGDSYDGSAGCAYAVTTSCNAAGYENLYQIRLLTYDAANSTNSATYDTADIEVNPNNGVWTQVYPAPAVATNTTTTTVTATSSPTVQHGVADTFTANVLGQDGSFPAGTVQFMDGTATLGAPINVDTTTGKAVSLAQMLSPGSHSITAVFTADDQATYGPSTSSPLSLVVEPVAVTPTVTGTAQVAKTLTCSEPTVLGESASFAWTLNGTKAATGRTYTLPATAAGKSVVCTATLAAGGATSSSKSSAAKKVALGAALKATTAPKLSGSDKVGKTEKVSSGKWSPAATKYTYQWYLGSAKIKGATKASYKLVKKDGGKKIKVKVTAEKTGYTSGSATTKALKVKK